MKYILPFLIAVLLNSCNKKEINTDTSNENIQSNFGVEQAEFILPDTLKVNINYDGLIKYKNDFDNFTKKSISENKFGRAIFFSYLKKGNPNDSFKQLQKKVTDTVLMENVHNIPINNIKYDKIGIFYIDGILRDMVIFDTIQNNEDIPMKIQDTRIIKKVVVIE